MKLVTAFLTNNHYGYPDGKPRKPGCRPFVIAMLHSTHIHGPVPNHGTLPTAVGERDFANKPGSPASATYYVDRDGTAVWAVDGAKYAPWNCGPWGPADPVGTNKGVDQMANAKPGCMSDECVWEQIEVCACHDNGYPWTDAQYEAVAEIIARVSKLRGTRIDRDTVLLHRDVRKGKPDDPWPRKLRETNVKRVIDRAKAIAGDKDYALFSQTDLMNAGGRLPLS
jgi:hypothetical protein